MLAAAQHNKLRSKRFCEDEITSCVFGPLEYLSSKDIWELLGSIIKPKLIDKQPWPDAPNDIEASLSFWEKIEISNTAKIEPDLIIRFRAKTFFQIILIEIKWGEKSGQHGSKGEERKIPNQLVKQWSALSPEERSAAFHLYLVEDKARAHNEFKKMFGKDGLKFNEYGVDRDRWKERLISVSWQELIYRIEIALNESFLANRQGLSHWAEQVACFLNYQEIQRFVGFKDLILLQPIRDLRPLYFWRHFSGFRHIKYCLEIPANDFSKGIFWQGSFSEIL